MKTRKLITIALLFLAITVCFMLFNKVEAAGLGYLSIIKERNATEEYIPIDATTDGPFNVTYKHQIGNNNSATTGIKNVWKIVTSTQAGTPTNVVSDLYCLRAGLGFATEPSPDVPDTTKVAVNYDLAYDIDEAGYARLQNYLYGTANNQAVKEAIPIFTDEHLDNFNAVLWLLDNMLLEDNEDVKSYLLEHAAWDDVTRVGYRESDFEYNEEALKILSKADIEAIQQLAIWYFTNTDDNLYHYEIEKGNAGTLEATLPTIFAALKSEEDFYNSQEEYKEYAELFRFVTFGEGDDAPPQIHDDGTKRQENAVKLYTTLLVKAKQAAANVKTTYNNAADKGTVSKLYTAHREITVYLAGANAVRQQPIVQVKEKEADIALRKFITKIENEDKVTVLDGANSREPKVITDEFNKVVGNKLQTTAKYEHPKTPVSVSKGDIVTYKIRLYNEGEVSAYVKQVTDYLPKYLMFDTNNDLNNRNWNVKRINGTEIEESTFITTEDCQIVGGAFAELDGKLKELNLGTMTDTEKLLKNVEIPAATKVVTQDGKTTYVLSYVDIEIRCKVSNLTPMEVAQTNIAEVTSMTDSAGFELKDRDSQVPELGRAQIPTNETDPNAEGYRPNYTGGDNNKNSYYDGSNVVNDKYYPGQQDDDDFDKVIVKIPSLDLALRKFIASVERNGEVTKYNRVPNPDLSGIEINGTANYKHTKEPVPVKEGDIVTYKMRIYNEGEEAGYVTEVKDYVAKYLKYLPSEQEKGDNNWWSEQEGQGIYNTLVTTDKCIVVGVSENMDQKLVGSKLADILIPAFDKEKQVLSYVEIEVRCKVLSSTIKTKITNIAEITQEAISDIVEGEDGSEVTIKIPVGSGENDPKDKDSQPGNVEVPETPKYPSLPDYKDGKSDENTYIPGQQDDDDFEKLVIEPYFDLALRKFITAVRKCFSKQ